LYFSADGKQLLATGDISHTADTLITRSTVWNARTGRVETTHRFVEESGLAVGYTSQGRVRTFVPSATSPDGSIAAVTLTNANAAGTGTVELRDSVSQRVIATLRGRPRVQAIGFDAAGRRVVTGNWDGSARVWDVATGRSLVTLAAHNGVVEAVAFSPDGTMLATAGDDTTAKLWDLEAGRRLLTLRGHTGSLTALAFSPDGTRLATGAVDGTVRVYVLPIDELMAISRARLTRGWTAAECARYLRSGRCPSEP
jgi:WD40 repeat protein